MQRMNTTTHVGLNHSESNKSTVGPPNFVQFRIMTILIIITHELVTLEQILSKRIS